MNNNYSGTRSNHLPSGVANRNQEKTNRQLDRLDDESNKRRSFGVRVCAAFAVAAAIAGAAITHTSGKDRLNAQLSHPIEQVDHKLRAGWEPKSPLEFVVNQTGTAEYPAQIAEDIAANGSVGTVKEVVAAQMLLPDSEITGKVYVGETVIVPRYEVAPELQASKLILHPGSNPIKR